MPVQPNDTVHIEGYNTSEGIYVVEARVISVNNGMAEVQEMQVHFPGGRTRPSTKRYEIRESHFDRPIAARLARLKEEADWLENLFRQPK